VRKTLIVSSVLVLVALVAVSGCAKSAGTSSLGPVTPGASATPSVPGGTAPSGSGSPTGSTGTPTATSTSTGGGNQPPSYPSDEKAYVTAMINAWAVRDTTREGQLAVAQAFDFLPRVDMHWHYYQCHVHDGAYEDCIYDNNIGDRITVVVDPTKVGKPMAVQSASIDRTSYPTDADSYVIAWTGAWDNGDRYRMIQLSDSSLTATMLAGGQPAPQGTMPQDATGAPAGYVWITVYSDNHDTFTVQVKTSLLSQPHAISAAPPA
jgi:hypothetical protein